MSANAIQHIFVLMLENRSFDHMLGFSGISGRDAETGDATRIDGLTGTESNQYAGGTYPVTPTADFSMPIDPGHEFKDVLEQLCGPGAQYNGVYPPVNNSGFVANQAGSNPATAAEVMKGYAPEKLTVLNALAREFVVCDNWHASVPGPTWPNRFFAHAASSAGLDHSPTVPEIVQWVTVSGLQFPNGTIYDALSRKGVTRRLYAGDDFPMVAALRGIGLGDVRPYRHFAADLQEASYPYSYIFIEPSYNIPNDYRGSTSQHPLGDVRLGEALLKSVYESLRNSRYWENSLLIVTWDEHGGFYDHAIPPAATPPSANEAASPHNGSRFKFDQYGSRVPALVISPLIPKNTIDHRLYDHSSILATVERRFGVPPLTQRDAAARDLLRLVTLETARTDAPERLPDPASVPGDPAPVFDPAACCVEQVLRPQVELVASNFTGVLHTALLRELDGKTEAQRKAILDQFGAIKTRAHAAAFLDRVRGGGAADIATAGL